MKLSKAERAHLERLLVHTFNGKRIVSSNVTTNATQTRHHVLCQLERKGAVTFEDDAGPLSQAFGVRFWHVRPTDAGLRLLEETPQTDGLRGSLRS